MIEDIFKEMGLLRENMFLLAMVVILVKKFITLIMNMFVKLIVYHIFS